MLKLQTQINLNHDKYKIHEFNDAMTQLKNKVILCNNSHGTNIDLKKRCFTIYDYEIDKSGQLYLIGVLDGPVKEVFNTLLNQGAITIDVMCNTKIEGCENDGLVLFYFYADAI